MRVCPVFMVIVSVGGSCGHREVLLPVFPFQLDCHTRAKEKCGGAALPPILHLVEAVSCVFTCGHTNICDCTGWHASVCVYIRTLSCVHSSRAIQRRSVLAPYFNTDLDAVIEVHSGDVPALRLGLHPPLHFTSTPFHLVSYTWATPSHWQCNTHTHIHAALPCLHGCVQAAFSTQNGFSLMTRGLH